jgi:hypothetical protein
VDSKNRTKKKIVAPETVFPSEKVSNVGSTCEKVFDFAVHLLFSCESGVRPVQRYNREAVTNGIGGIG